MRKIFVSTILAGFVGFGSFTALNAASYTADVAHSSVAFKVSHMVVSTVDGNFNKFSGEAEIDKGVLKSINGEIEIASVNTRNDGRDKHLQGADFFDAAKFPTGTLKSTKITKVKNGVKVEADLTLHGVTKKVVLNGELKGPGVNEMTKKELYGLTLNGQINRKDFGIGATSGSASIGEQVEINISLELAAK
ncbi:polyisoprenoid-binding protein [Helicobacter saguini]|uniref:Polyisoprenoid-binding protein n=1 Tax=Helicobacter saguini TaxID=1548018 RepID=A0A347VT08_9HELI|nr:YceI family protein [Helicobacter saguini]MWV62286.1 polyisoprenoid-binding protein [Helicobacter saguini]MWV67041.1 polyisoprenoid-binding protein [Helicobacter saguini]MWV69391.1 polyisoprenoid-binding protein [Helicobacter saguini]MWV71055.1 polyisoprenoid-binding protein [Helicobacter saguini]TLD95042.1 polyisoprenoid-binding protein [Helicobacter saguini]